MPYGAWYIPLALNCHFAFMKMPPATERLRRELAAVDSGSVSVGVGLPLVLYRPSAVRSAPAGCCSANADAAHPPVRQPLDDADLEAVVVGVEAGHVRSSESAAAGVTCAGRDERRHAVGAPSGSVPVSVGPAM